MALTLDAEHNCYKKNALGTHDDTEKIQTFFFFFFGILDLRLDIKDRHLASVAMSDTPGPKRVTDESARNEFVLLNWLAHSSSYPCTISPICFLMSCFVCICN